MSLAGAGLERDQRLRRSAAGRTTSSRRDEERVGPVDVARDGDDERAARLGRAAAADAAADGASEVDGAVDGAVVGAAADGAVLVVAPPHAAKTIASRRRAHRCALEFIDPPPLCGSSPPGVPTRGWPAADPNAGQDTVGLPRSYLPIRSTRRAFRTGSEGRSAYRSSRGLGRETVSGAGRRGALLLEEGRRRRAPAPRSSSSLPSAASDASADAGVPRRTIAVARCGRPRRRS